MYTTWHTVDERKTAVARSTLAKRLRATPPAVTIKHEWRDLYDELHCSAYCSFWCHGDVIDIVGPRMMLFFSCWLALILTCDDCNDINGRLSAHTRVHASDVSVAVPARQSGAKRFHLRSHFTSILMRGGQCWCLDTMCAVSSIVATLRN
jgi:hypothetical protein